MTFSLSSINIKEPTKEDFERYKLDQVDRSMNDQNAFPFWYRSVEKLGVRSPKTAIVDFPPLATYCLVGDKISDDDKITAEALIAGAIDKIRAFGSEVGYPIFIKNSFTSAKHYWNNSCFIKSENDDIRGKLQELANYLLCHTPLIALHVIPREFIQTNPAFFAFNGMPIAEEYRVFANDGKILGWQPYWPERSIQNPSDPQWKAELSQISTPSNDDIEEMTTVSEAITRDLGGYWSVDFLKDKNGDLWLIDMALGNMSFKCNTGYVEIQN